jgi:hypothetical protein
LPFFSFNFSISIESEEGEKVFFLLFLNEEKVKIFNYLLGVFMIFARATSQLLSFRMIDVSIQHPRERKMKWLTVAVMDVDANSATSE